MKTDNANQVVVDRLNGFLELLKDKLNIDSNSWKKNPRVQHDRTELVVRDCGSFHESLRFRENEKKIEFNPFIYVRAKGKDEIKLARIRSFTGAESKFKEIAQRAYETIRKLHPNLALEKFFEWGGKTDNEGQWYGTVAQIHLPVSSFEVNDLLENEKEAIAVAYSVLTDGEEAIGINSSIFQRNTDCSASVDEAESTTARTTDNVMEEEDMVTELVEMVKKSHNVVLTGAPGTGKTYLARKVARAMVLSGGKKKLSEEEIEELIESRTCFVQFHPSYDYTDFVEGLRPIQDADGQVGFERQDGAFKKLCKNACGGVDNFEDVWSKFIAYLEERHSQDNPLELMTPDKKSKFKVFANKRGNLSLVTAGSDKVQGTLTKANIRKFYEAQLEFDYWSGYFNGVITYLTDENNGYDLKKNGRGREEPSKEKPKFVMIIDEINRGDISKIFGELFYAIDEGYRGPQGRVSTQYQNLVKDGDPFFKGFYVPENVYIIGTMNDIDRSVESMDFAIRRRFTWFEVPADSKVLEDAKDENNEPKIDVDVLGEARNRMDNLNAAIRDVLGSAYEIGPAYYLKLKQYKDDKDKTGFDNLWKMNLELLLREYLRGNPKEEIEEKIKVFRAAFDNKSRPSKEEADRGGKRVIMANS